MVMDSHDKRKNKKRQPLSRSFYYAAAGIILGMKKERNVQIHLTATVMVFAGSIYFSISKIEWVFILLAVGGMLALELMNSAVERVVDLVTANYHPLAKQAKDLAAGAVLIYAIVVFVIGLLIFVPKIIARF